jgi:hypothetical protein
LSLWGNGDTIEPAEVLVIEIAVSLLRVVPRRLPGIKNELPLGVVFGHVEFSRFMVPIPVFFRCIALAVSSVPVMIVSFVDDARNLTEASGARFVERRFLNRRIVLQKHAFDDGALEATVFGESVPFTGAIAGLLEFVAAVLLGFAAVLDGMWIQDAESVCEAVVGQFDIPRLVDIGLVG